jgi:hypothetical protein
MAPYLATATNGVFSLTVTELAGGIPSYVAVDPRRTNTAVLAHIPAMMAFFSDTYGPYPFDATRAIVDFAPHVGYALETQTKANYSNTPGESTLAHEIAHEWFGNAVTLSNWPDIWLNEASPGSRIGSGSTTAASGRRSSRSTSSTPARRRARSGRPRRPRCRGPRSCSPARPTITAG